MNIVFAGTPRFAAQHLTGILSSALSHNLRVIGVVTQPDKPGKRGKKLIPSDVKVVALEHDLTVLQPKKLTAKDLQPFNIDVLIVVAYGQILKTDVLTAPAYGCINVHGSLLPRWRGASPIQRAILAGDNETGVSIIQMDRGLDTGDILAARAVPIGKTDTSGSLSDKLSALGIDALIEVCDKIPGRHNTPVVQTEDGSCYAHKISKQEANIDWQASNVSIERAIRALNPDPVCFTFLDSLRVRLFKASVSRVDSQPAFPGEVLAVSKKGVDVACGTGSILLEQIQLPVGKGSILTGSDILNSRSDLIFTGANFCSQH